MNEQEAVELLQSLGYVLVPPLRRHKYSRYLEKPERKPVVCHGCGQEFLAYVFGSKYRNKEGIVVRHWYFRFWCNRCIYKRRLIRQYLKETNSENPPPGQR